MGVFGSVTSKRQNSLLFSLLAGNLGRRPVRGELRRQPGSAVSVERFRIIGKPAPLRGLRAFSV